MTNSWSEVWQFRTSLYRSLASIVLEPITEEGQEILTTEFWSSFPLEAANDKIKNGLDGLQDCTAKLSSLTLDQACEDVMVEYTKLFIGPGRPKAPLFASFYHSNKKLFFGETTISMKQLLKDVGLESKKKDKQPEDHLGLELMFLSLQSEKLAEASLEEQIKNVNDQQSFINHFLLSWIPQLCKDAKEHKTIGFYSSLFDLIHGVLLWDIDLLEEFLKSEQLAKEVSKN